MGCLDVVQEYVDGATGGSDTFLEMNHAMRDATRRTLEAAQGEVTGIYLSSRTLSAESITRFISMNTFIGRLSGAQN